MASRHPKWCLYPVRPPGQRICYLENGRPDNFGVQIDVRRGDQESWRLALLCTLVSGWALQKWPLQSEIAMHRWQPVQYSLRLNLRREQAAQLSCSTQTYQITRNRESRRQVIKPVSPGSTAGGSSISLAEPHQTRPAQRGVGLLRTPARFLRHRGS